MISWLNPLGVFVFNSQGTLRSFKDIFTDFKQISSLLNNGEKKYIINYVFKNFAKINRIQLLLFIYFRKELLNI